MAQTKASAAVPLSNEDVFDAVWSDTTPSPGTWRVYAGLWKTSVGEETDQMLDESVNLRCFKLAEGQGKQINQVNIYSNAEATMHQFTKEDKDLQEMWKTRSANCVPRPQDGMAEKRFDYTPDHPIFKTDISGYRDELSAQSGAVVRAVSVGVPGHAFPMLALPPLPAAGAEARKGWWGIEAIFGDLEDGGLRMVYLLIYKTDTGQLAINRTTREFTMRMDDDKAPVDIAAVRQSQVDLRKQRPSLTQPVDALMEGKITPGSGHATTFFYDKDMKLCKREEEVSWSSTAGPETVELHFTNRSYARGPRNVFTADKEFVFEMGVVLSDKSLARWIFRYAGEDDRLVRSVTFESFPDVISS